MQTFDGPPRGQLRPASSEPAEHRHARTTTTGIQDGRVAAFQSAVDQSPRVLTQRRELQSVVEVSTPQRPVAQAQVSARGAVIQRLGFRVNQAQQVINWLITANLDNLAPFQGLVARFYQANNALQDDDAEGISLLFLTMVGSYRDAVERPIIINYLYNRYSGFYPGIGLIGARLPPQTVPEFTNGYKTFFHLYRRALAANLVGMAAIHAAHQGMLGLAAPLGNQAQGPLVVGAANVRRHRPRIRRILIAARAGNLTFPSQENAISHLVKHGAMYNNYRRIAGTEGAAALGAMVDNYVEDANYAIANGREQVDKRDVTLDRRVYTFKTEFETAMVSCAEDGSDAFIATYFWHEPANYVNEVTPDTGTNPNLA